MKATLLKAPLHWMDVLVTVEFYAPERGLFDVQYDGRKPTAGSGAYSDNPADSGHGGSTAEAGRNSLSSGLAQRRRALC